MPNLNELDDELMKLRSTRPSLTVREARLERLVVITALNREYSKQLAVITARIKELTDEGDRHVSMLR